jgi:hypothetical protein
MSAGYQVTESSSHHRHHILISRNIICLPASLPTAVTNMCNNLIRPNQFSFSSLTISPVSIYPRALNAFDIFGIRQSQL